MKKIILITCVMVSSGIAAMAQLPNFTFGIKGGANFSKLKTKEDLTDENSIAGYHIGVFTRLGAAGIFVQPELYLGSKGNDFVQVKTASNTTTAKGKVRFTTLDLPLLLGTKIGPSKLNVRLMAGPVVSFVVNENTTFDSAYQNIKDFNNYKKQNWAYQAGAGVDLGNLTLDARYEGGLSNVSRSDEYNQKQNLFHLSLGIKLL